MKVTITVGGTTRECEVPDDLEGRRIGIGMTQVSNEFVKAYQTERVRLQAESAARA